MGAILAFLSSVVASNVTSSVVKFLAYKIILTTLIIITLPLVLKGVIGWFFNESWSFISSKLLSLPSLPDMAYQFTGLAGYFAQHLRFVDCFSVLLTGLLIHFTLRLIPGL